MCARKAIGPVRAALSILPAFALEKMTGLGMFVARWVSHPGIVSWRRV